MSTANEKYVHATLRKPGMDLDTEKPLFKPQKFVTSPKGFDRFLANRQGLKIISINKVPKGYEIPKPKALKKNAPQHEKDGYDAAMKDYDALVAKMPKKKRATVAATVPTESK